MAKKKQPFSKGTMERFNQFILQGKTAIDVFSEVYNESTADLVYAHKQAERYKGQFYRRVFLRILYSHSEAMIFQLKQYLISQREFLPFKLTEQHRIILNDQKLEIDSNGSVKVKDLNPDHITNIKFTFKFLARYLTLDKSPNFSCKGWESYQTGLRKRHSLTHPKFIADFKISDEDLVNLMEAEEWLMKELENLFNGLARIKDLQPEPKPESAPSS